MHSDPGDEWQFPNRATPLGSPAYYAVRFSPPQQRHRNAMLLAWLDQIQQTVDHPPDPGVARLKLDWWRNEIATLDGMQPRHPLLQGLVGEGLDGGAAPYLQAIVDAAELELNTRLDDAGFIAACTGGMGGLFSLLAMLDDMPGAEHAGHRAAGGFVAAVERLRCLAQAPHRVPDSLQPGRLRILPDEERTARLDKLIDAFNDAGSRTPLPALAARLYATSAAIHRKMRAKSYPIDSYVDRAPIAHLWTAWRCR